MDYDKFKALIDYAPTNGMYETLMAKESSVLETVNRVVDHSNRKELLSKEVVNTPVKQVVRHFGTTMKDMFTELFTIRHTKDVITLFTKETSRIIYIGVVIVCIAFFLYFVTVTE